MMEWFRGKELRYGIRGDDDSLPAVRAGDDSINAIVRHGQFLATIQATKLDHGPLLGRNRWTRMPQPATRVNSNPVVPPEKRGEHNPSAIALVSLGE
jgi:hypothetical protein